MLVVLLHVNAMHACSSIELLVELIACCSLNSLHLYLGVLKHSDTLSQVQDCPRIYPPPLNVSETSKPKQNVLLDANHNISIMVDNGVNECVLCECI